jgi:hypothetical protein
MTTDQDRLLAKYLLGTLPEAEEMRLEAEYLADADAQERLAMAEDELVDAYVRNQLSREDCQKLEARFLASPRGRQKLELARALHALAAQAPVAIGTSSVRRVRRRWIGIAAAAAVAAMLALMLLKRGGSKPPVQSERAASEPRQPTPPAAPSADQPQPPPAQAQAPSAPSSAQLVAFAMLKPGLTRDASALKRVHIPAGATELTLELDLDADRHARYRVELLGDGEQVRWRARDLKSRRARDGGRAILLRLPTNLFHNTEYTLVLSPDEAGATAVAEFGFAVRRD